MTKYKERNWVKTSRVLKVLITFVLILSFLIYPVFVVDADQVQGYVSGNDVNVRTGHSTSHSRLQDESGNVVQLSREHPVTILEQSNETSWYKIRFDLNGVTREGWMSNQYIRIDNGEDSEFESYLDAQGFPESYRPYLRDLNAKHPNWKFTALHTGLDWNTVLKNQLNPVYRNMVPASSITSWKSIEGSAYNWDTGQWTNFEPGWVGASSEVLQHFMDPRNGLVDSGEILQFLCLGYEGLETKEGVQNILRGTFMASSSLDYAQYFMDAGKLHGVSPYHLASRVIQEVGINGSTTTKGPYYNFYNIGATGANPAQAGIDYAKAKGWDTPEKAIKEGAGFITNGYINTGQDTLYLQKFDVVDGGNGYYWHQYMSNIQAPTREAANMKKTFPNFNTAEFIFKIPVYLNMPASAVPKPISNTDPNYLLASLKVNDYQLTPVFNKFTKTYSIIVPENVSSITVSASPIRSTTNVTGTGTHNLSPGINEIKITSKAQSGASTVYTINVSRGIVDTPTPTPTPTPPPTTPTPGPTVDTSYKVGTRITGVSPGTSIDGFKANYKVTNGTVEIRNADGSAASGNVGTGKIVRVMQGGNVVEEHQVVMYGDTNGDGIINIVDLANVQKHLLNVSKLSGPYAEAANTKKSGSAISIVDLANVQKHLLNVSSIKQ